MLWLLRKKSGKKEYALLTADDARELERMARRLRVRLHGKGAQEKHLDLSGHKVEVAKKWGACLRLPTRTQAGRQAVEKTA